MIKALRSVLAAFWAKTGTGFGALLAFCSVAVGLWMAWPPLAPIVCGTVVFVALSVKHFRQGDSSA